MSSKITGIWSESVENIRNYDRANLNTLFVANMSYHKPVQVLHKEMHQNWHAVFLLLYMKSILYFSIKDSCPSCMQGVLASLPNSVAPQTSPLVQWGCCGTHHPLRTPSSLNFDTLCTSHVKERPSPPSKCLTYSAPHTPSMVYRLPHNALCRWLYTAHSVKETLTGHW